MDSVRLTEDKQDHRAVKVTWVILCWVIIGLFSGAGLWVHHALRFDLYDMAVDADAKTVADLAIAIVPSMIFVSIGIPSIWYESNVWAIRRLLNAIAKVLCIALGFVAAVTMGGLLIFVHNDLFVGTNASSVDTESGVLWDVLFAVLPSMAYVFLGAPRIWKTTIIAIEPQPPSLEERRRALQESLRDEEDPDVIAWQMAGERTDQRAHVLSGWRRDHGSFMLRPDADESETFVYLDDSDILDDEDEHEPARLTLIQGTQSVLLLPPSCVLMESERQTMTDGFLSRTAEDATAPRIIADVPAERPTVVGCSAMQPSHVPGTAIIRLQDLVEFQDWLHGVVYRGFPCRSVSADGIVEVYGSVCTYARQDAELEW